MNDPDIIYPITTVDVVLLTISSGQLCVLLLKREQDPFKGSWALPGGWVRTNEDETVEAAAHRVLRDKVGMPPYHLEQLGVFSGASRDPRGWSLSVSHLALVPHEELEDLDQGHVSLFPVEEALKAATAFRHDEIIAAALQRLRGKGAYSSLPASLLQDGFSLAQLHQVYEIISGEEINSASFRRKVLDLGFIQETGESRIMPGHKKPSVLYRVTDRARTFHRTLTQV